MNPMYGRRLIGLGVILLAAALAASPILLHGSFCGDDFEFHVVSWFDVQQSWLMESSTRIGWPAPTSAQANRASCSIRR
jgi:hypothetical protein